MKAILFDLDGTLLDRDASVRAFIASQYERLQQHFEHIPKEQYMKRFIELDNKGYVWKDKVYAELTQEFEINSISAEALLEDYIAEFQHHCVEFQGLHEMLMELKKCNLKLGMITNGYGQFQLNNIKALGIENYFDVILISEWEGIKKPNPKIFERALQKLQVEPTASIFVGDHPINDVEAAKSLGMIGVWKEDNGWNEAKADYTIEHLSEIPNIVKGIKVCKEIKMSIRAISKQNRSAVTAFFEHHWGSSEMVITSGVYKCNELDGFIYSNRAGEIIGLITYVIREGECEIISLDSIVEGQGIGSQLLTKVEQAAMDNGCKRLSLITTNDNLHAMKFYQKRGYRIVQVLPNAVDEARKVKPTIPLIGNDGIPLKDELRLEKIL